MMGTRERLRGGDEWDYLTKGRRFFRKRPGKFAAVKARFWRRVRKLRRLETKAAEE